MGYRDAQAQAQYQREWVAARRRTWIAANGPCAICGSSNDLEVDHIDPATKIMNPGTLWSMSPTNPLRIAELAKCQVLCRACHGAKTASPHGTKQRYNRYHCRCAPCKAANTAHKRKQRSNNKEM